MYLLLCYQNVSSACYAYYADVLYTRMYSIFHLQYQNLLFYVEMQVIAFIVTSKDSSTITVTDSTAQRLYTLWHSACIQ